MSLVPPEPESEPAPVYRTETSSGAVRPVTIAHRCGAGLGPENTCGAVVQSSFFRPDFYEIDIRHTADGVPVCLHDERLDRTTDLSGNISELTWAEIMNADTGNWFGSTFRDEPIPRLETMLDCVNPSPLAIELKEPEISEAQCNAIAGLLREVEDSSSVILSFHESALEQFRQSDNSVRTCFLTLEMNEYALNGPHDIVGLLATACTEETVVEIQNAGKAVWVWTVNDNFDNYIRMRVDGIVTDYPDRLRRALPPS